MKKIFHSLQLGGMKRLSIENHAVPIMMWFKYHSLSDVVRERVVLEASRVRHVVALEPYVEKRV